MLLSMLLIFILTLLLFEQIGALIECLRKIISLSDFKLKPLIFPESFFVRSYMLFEELFSKFVVEPLCKVMIYLKSLFLKILKV